MNWESEQHQKALDFLKSVPLQKVELVISSQNILETVSVLIHGLKVPRHEAVQAMGRVLKDSSFSFIYPNSLSIKNFFRLVSENTYVHSTDLFLAATALANNVTVIATGDRDFEKIKGIKVYNPFSQ